MENPATFDLNQAIQQWREQIAISPAFRERDLDELEDHFRETIASLELRGLTAQEAFWIARDRLGSDDLLSAEFGKMNKSKVWIDRALWMVLGSITLSVLSSISYSMANLADLGLLLLLGGRGFIPVSLAIFPFSFGLLLLLLWRWGNRSNAALARVGRWMQVNPVAVTISVIVLLALLQAMHFGIMNFTVRSLPLEHLAIALKWRSSYGFLFILVIPALLGWLLYRTRRQREAASQR